VSLERFLRSKNKFPGHKVVTLVFVIGLVYTAMGTIFRAVNISLLVEDLNLRFK
jgi:hypothetical protein